MLRDNRERERERERVIMRGDGEEE